MEDMNCEESTMRVCLSNCGTRHHTIFQKHTEVRTTQSNQAVNLQFDIKPTVTVT